MSNNENSNNTSPLRGARLVEIMQMSIDQNLETIRSPLEALALFAHACMLAVDFTLIGLSEDDRIDHIEANDIKQLPSQWKDSTSYGFRYKHEQSSMQYLLKIHRLGGKSIITGLGLGDDKTATLEITTKDFFSESFFPFSPTLSHDNNDNKKLDQGFISSSRLADLANLFKLQIIQKLIPGLHKPGYEEDKNTTDTSTSTGSSRSQQSQIPGQRQPLRDEPPPPAIPQPHDPSNPLRYPPRHPRPFPAGETPPGFEDEFEMQRSGQGFGVPGSHPFDIGSHDLNPPGLGRNPPLVGPFFGEPPRGGMSPYGEFGGPGGGGMYPTGSHPMFGNRGGGGGVGGTRQGDPRFPPGSRYIYNSFMLEVTDIENDRYDPVGPGGNFGGGGAGGHNPFSGFNQDDFI